VAGYVGLFLTYLIIGEKAHALWTASQGNVTSELVGVGIAAFAPIYFACKAWSKERTP
jgi:hypothetical protein